MLRVDDLLVLDTASVRSTIEKITSARSGIALVVDKDGRFQGVVADGDIRRALLKKLDLEAPVSIIINREAVFATTQMSDEEREQLSSLRYRVIPVLDEERKVVDILWYSPDERTWDIKHRRVAVIGLGFVGLTLAVTLADAGFRISGVDASPLVRRKLEKGKSDFHESGLQMYLDRNLGIRFNVSANLSPHANDVYIICVGTPLDRSTKTAILKHIESATRMVGKLLKSGDLVVLRSTVPVGTTRNLVLPLLEAESALVAGTDFGLVFAPERTVAGQALRELRELPQIIGGLNQQSTDLASRLFSKMTATIVDVGSPEAAEMGKLIDNSYRDVTFAYANQIALLCERIGLDMVELIRAVNLGYTRNNVPVPSPGVGGSCLSKDPYILLDVGKKYGYVPRMVKTAREINESIPVHLAQKTVRLLREAGKDPADRNAFILGFAFKGKPETSDMRESPTLSLVQELKHHGLKVLGFDPVVDRKEIEALGVTFVGIDEGFSQADAAIIMTNHPQFSSLDIFKMLPMMRLPAVFIDGWHLFDPRDVCSIPGIFYGGVGND